MALVIKNGAQAVWPMVATVLLLALASHCSSPVTTAVFAASNVRTEVKATWESPPLYMEASEVMAGIENGYFWQFVNRISSNKDSEPSQQLLSDKGAYERATAIAEQILPQIVFETFHLSLLARSASPKVSMFFQIASDDNAVFNLDDETQCSFIVAANQQATCEIDKIASLLSAEPARIFSADHVYAGGANASAPALVLYADLGSPDFPSWHAAMAQLAAEGTLQYILRHRRDPFLEMTTASSILMAGWGVEMAVKKTEYTLTDDSNIDDSDEVVSSTQEDEDEEDEVDGFSFTILKQRYPEQVENFDNFLAQLKNESSAILQPRQWELQDISLQTAQRILSSSNPLFMLKRLTQNFPAMVGPIIKTQVKEALRAEVEANRALLSNQEIPSNLLALGGQLIDLSNTDLFDLLKLLQEESSSLSAFQHFNFPQQIVASLRGILGQLSSSGSGGSGSVGDDGGDGASATRTDYLDLRDDTHVVWLNDLASDSKYRQWPNTLRYILQRTMPGQIIPVRKNTYNLVICGDLGEPALQHLLKAAYVMYTNSFVTRNGFVFYSKEGQAAIYTKNMNLLGVAGEDASLLVPVGDADLSLSVKLMRAFFYIKAKKGDRTALQFLADFFTEHTSLADQEKNLEGYFKKVYKKGAWKDEVISAGAAEAARQAADLYAFKLGVAASSDPSVFFNGEEISGATPDNLQNVALEKVRVVFPYLQRATYYGQLSDADDVLDHLMELGNIVPAISPQWLRKPAAVLPLDHQQQPMEESGDNSTQPSSSASSASSSSSALTAFMTSAPYFHMPKTSKKVKATTVWLFCDFDTRGCIFSAASFLSYLGKQQTVRVAFGHSGAGGTDGEDVATFLSVAARELSSSAAHTVASGVIAALRGGKSRITKNMLDKKNWSKVETPFEEATSSRSFSAEARAVLDAVVALVSAQEGIADASVRAGPIVVMNGVAYSSGAATATVSDSDIQALAAFDEKMHKTQRVYEVLRPLAKTHAAAQVTGAIAGVLGIIASSQHQTADGGQSHGASIRRQRQRLDTASLLAMLSTEHTAVDMVSAMCTQQVQESGDQALCHQVVAMLDPATEEAQRAAATISLLMKHTSVQLTLLLNPSPEVSEMPLKRFYRAVQPGLAFSTDGTATGPHALFSNLPTAPLLTLGLETPSSWVVKGIDAKHDLDNIHLQNSKRGVRAVFSLAALTVEGSCTDADSRRPVPGLQLELGTKTEGAVVDTLVMANLGYFQLKAPPGAWQVNLRHGRSEMIYAISKVAGAETAASSSTSTTDPVVLLADLSGTYLQVHVARREGMESEQLLDTEGDAAQGTHNAGGSSGLWGSVKKFMGNDEAAKAQKMGTEESPLETINVFSLASGHLYERFLKIMMLSVLKNTRNPVKFWFLENCMSPQMKSFLPHMAEQYGFDFQLVSYNWPAWLNKPKEKMRLIWAYKILFLDVLFPLDVKKIIFVDADQVVRADLRELVELDLKGAPYGYTPFCSSREGMGGFRFWESGYWKSHLRNKPYHISALYVVDLVRFRQFAAGDRLREQYQMLSRDPNSLSNLDQDLPNNMVHQVPIFSLPQEWLWCESWCDDTSKKKAKTIDLCNNPKTKEPKLDAAVRIIPEWTALDNEARAATLAFERAQTGHDESGAANRTDGANSHDEL